MKNIFLALSLSLLCPTRAAKADERTTRHITTALFVAAQASLAVDAMQTWGIARSCRGHCVLFGLSETNPLLGRHPSDGVVLGYFAGIVLAQTAAYLGGPSWLSMGTSTVTLGLEVPQIVRNVRVGVHMTLPF